MSIESNKRIARFMGYVYEPKTGWVKPNGKRHDIFRSHWFLARHHKDLKYDQDLNELFKVLVKIKNLGFLVVTYDLNLCVITKRDPKGLKDVIQFNSKSDTNAGVSIYEAIVKFLDWYENSTHQ